MAEKNPPLEPEKEKGSFRREGEKPQAPQPPTTPPAIRESRRRERGTAEEIFGIQSPLPQRSSRNPFRSPRANRSRSNSRVSIDRAAQTQAEANEYVQRIRAGDGGVLMVSLLRWLNTLPDITVDSVSYTHLTLPTTPYV